MGSFASGVAIPTHVINDSHPEHTQGLNETSDRMQATKATSVAVAQPEQPQLNQMSSSTTVAYANIAAGGGIWQEAPCSVAAEVLNKAPPRETFAAAGGADKAIDAVRNATGNVAYQSNLPKGEASEADDMGDELFEPQIVAGGSTIALDL